MMELGTFYHRYMSAVMHTVVVGQPSRAVERLVKASAETLSLIQQNVKPGRAAHEVACEAKNALRDVDEEAYSTGMFGYSVGRTLVVAPA